MKQKTGLLFIVLLVILSGCMPASIKTTPIVPERTETFKPFSHGTVMVKNVGEQLIGYNLKLQTNIYPGFVATEAYQLPSVGIGGVTKMPLIKKSSQWAAVSKMQDGGYIVQNKKEKMMTTFSSSGLSTPWEICLAVTEGGTPFGYADCQPSYSTYVISWKIALPTIFSPMKIFEKGLKARREAAIVYGGKTKNTIKLIYQETLLKDMEFVYDLSEGRDVAVKDIILEVIEATNISIKYIIKTSPNELKSKIKKREKERQRLEQI